MNETILVTKSSMPTKEEYFEEISSLWESHWLTNMGEKHCELEKRLIDYLDVPNLSLFCNGHMALELAIQGMKLQGEVITTPFTFASTTHAIVRNGLKPIFCDIDKHNYTMDVSKIEKLVTEKTCAIMPVHVYGNVCDIQAIDKIAEKYNLKVIYDAAHAFGIKYKGRGIGTYGDASMFSFHATKVFNTIEGGAVSYTDKEFGKKLYELKNFGIEGPESVTGVGANAKMNEFQAAMGICNLRHIDVEIEKRKKIYIRYMEQLSEIKGIKLPTIQGGVTPNYAYFPVVFDRTIFGWNRDEVAAKLAENNIYARKYFYPIASEFECYKEIYDGQATPIALEVSKNILTLPIYAELQIEDVDRICDIIKNMEN